MERISQFMTELVLAQEKDKLAGPEIDKRIFAMREMFRGLGTGHLSGPQFQEAMTTSQFTHYFGDALSRMFLKDYEYAVGAWKAYTYPDTAPDFRAVKRFRMTEPETLARRGEKAETIATYVAESEIDISVGEYSRQFDISWQTLMNDDLGKLKETPARMARAAARFEDAFVSNLYDNATVQATLAALGAPWAGTGRLTAANLAIAINAMATRTDAGGNIMNIKKFFLVIPPILKIQAAQILRDLIQYGGPNSNVLSTFIDATPVVDPYITTAAPNVPWYLVADPSEIPAITVLRLQGYANPFTFQKKSDVEIVSGNAPAAFLMGNFATGDIEYGVETIIGGWDSATLTGVTDFRGLYYSSGTTA